MSFDFESITCIINEYRAIIREKETIKTNKTIQRELLDHLLPKNKQ